MNRQNLINRLVAKKMQNAGKVGCVPCFGAAARVICINAAAPQTGTAK